MKKRMAVAMMALLTIGSVITGCQNSNVSVSKNTASITAPIDTSKENIDHVATQSEETNIPSEQADEFEILQNKEDGIISGDHYLGTDVNTVTWGRLPNKDTAPALVIKSGETVTIDTLSHEGILEDQGKNPIAYFGKFGIAEDQVLDDAKEIASSNLPHNFDEDGPHVITGPIFVEEAQPGDVLKVEVLSLTPRVPYGIITNRHYKGALPEEFPENEGRQEGASAENYELYNNVSIFAPIKEVDGSYYCYLDDPNQEETNLWFPIHPFLGTMGVAANSSESASTVPPTRLGGNLDINELGEGSTLYLPVDVNGALFYTGDPHFAQGDGEVALTALEGSLRATVRLTVLKNGTEDIVGNSNDFTMAFGETQDYWIPIGLNEDLDEAMKQSVRESIDFISEQFSIQRSVAYAYLSAATDYEVSQVIDKTKGIHALIPKINFKDYTSYCLKSGDNTYDLVIHNDEYYVNADTVLKQLGATTELNSETNTYTVTYKDSTYKMTIGSNCYEADTKIIELADSPYLEGEQVYIPVSSFLSVFRIPLNWSTSGNKITGTLGF